MGLCGISDRFQPLSPSMRQVTHALLTRPPLSFIFFDESLLWGTPFDLHVLGTPPAFILSQDQTLSIIDLQDFYIFRSHIFFVFSFVCSFERWLYLLISFALFRSLLCFRRFLFFWNLRGLCINSLLVFIVLLFCDSLFNLSHPSFFVNNFFESF